jgi:hypothetical protein
MAPAGSLHPQVDVNLDEIRENVDAGEYRPTPNDQVMKADHLLSTEWPEPPLNGHLHIFVTLPGAEGSPTLFQGDFRVSFILACCIAQRDLTGTLSQPSF